MFLSKQQTQKEFDISENSYTLDQSNSSTNSISIANNTSLPSDINEAKNMSTVHGSLTKISQRTFSLFGGKSNQYFVLIGQSLLRYKYKYKDFVLCDKYSITSSTNIHVTDNFKGEKYAFCISNLDFELNLIAEDSFQLSQWLKHIKAAIVTCKFSEKPLPTVPQSDVRFEACSSNFVLSC